MATEQKTFYSDCAGLVIHVNVGELRQVGSEIKRVGEKHIHFTPFGKGVLVNGKMKQFGQTTTADPEIVEYLEKRSENEGDVMTPEQFNRLLVSPQDQIAEGQRTIQRLQNQLADVLAKQGKAPRQ